MGSVRTPHAHGQTALPARLSVSILLLSSLVTPRASAQDGPEASLPESGAPPAAGAVTFDEAIGLTAAAPEVRALDDALGARRTGDDRISDTTEHSRFYVMPGVRALSEQDRGFEGQVQIGHSWNLAGLADARRHTASEEREALSARGRAAALGRRLEAAFAWVDLRRAETELQLVSEVAEVAHQMADRTGVAASGGVLTEADHAEAEAFAAQADALTLAAEGALVVTQIALARAMGTGDAAGLVAAGPTPTPSVPDAEAIERALRDVEHRPRVVAARLAALAIRARDAELVAERGTRLDADLMVYRESPGGLLVFPQIGVSVPFTDLAARDRSVLEEQAAIADGTAEATRFDALRESYEVAHDVEHSRATVELLSTSLVPTLDRLATLRARQLTVGETTVLIALDAQRRLLRARADLAAAEADRTWAEVRAWLLLAELAGTSTVDRADGSEP